MNWREELKNIAGSDSICRDPEKISQYFSAPVDSSEPVVVTPSEPAQVIEIVKLASREKIPLFTINGRRLPPEATRRAGIILSFERLNRILEIDPMNLHAIVEPGVTFADLQKELDRRPEEKLRLAFPARADSESVLSNYLQRNITLRSPSLRGRILNISNFHVVLPGEGKVYKSGSHLVSEKDHFPEEQSYGPSISYLFYGMDDLLGVPIKAVVYLFPVQEARKIIGWGFPDANTALTFLKTHCRSDRFLEAFLANRRFLSMILASEPGMKKNAELRLKLPTWIVGASLEGSEEFIQVTEDILQKSARDLRAEPLDLSLLPSLNKSLDRPWYQRDRDAFLGFSSVFPFYATFGRADDFEATMRESIPKTGINQDNIGKLFIPLKQGRSVYCEYDFYFSQDEKARSAEREEIFTRLIQAGALVDRPAGKLAAQVFNSNPAYLKLMREIKIKIDPDGILNPHLFIKGVS